MRLVNFLRRHWVRMGLGLVLTGFFVLHANRTVDAPFIRKMDYLTYDFRLNLTMPTTVDKRIVIVDIDERSLAEEGRWPWPRDKLSRLVDHLFDHYQVAVVGFDVVFAEADEDRVLNRIESLTAPTDDARWQQLLDIVDPLRDAAFAKSLAGRKTILGYYFSHHPEHTETSGVLPEPVLPAEIADALEVSTVRTYGYGANLPVLQAAAAGAGYFDNVLSDEDGVFRRAPLLQSYKGALYESLSVAVAEAYLGQTLGFGDNNEAVTIGERAIAVDGIMAALIPYRGTQGSFRYISATDILAKRLDADFIKGDIVLVGTTAPGLYDLRNTPVQKVYPGVEIHANLVSGILDGRFLKNPPYTLASETLALVLVGLVLVFAMPALSAALSSLLSLVVLAAVVLVNLYFWQVHALVLPLAGVLLLILALYLLNMTYGFLTESRHKRDLTRRFGQYVPPEIVGEMSEDPKSYSLAGERRSMTVLFSDVRGFTRISEGLDPVELTRLMNRLLTPMTQTIHAQRGTIDKYMGDAIMAFWGAPLPDDQHAAHAVAAALEMQQILATLRDEFRAQHWPEVRMGIGINSGPMSVGNMGSEFRMAYTVLGDAVNLGARLEGLTKQYGVGIVVSETTRDAAPGFRYRELDLVRVKGREQPLRIFEPLGVAGTLEPAAEEIGRASCRERV